MKWSAGTRTRTNKTIFLKSGRLFRLFTQRQIRQTTPRQRVSLSRVLSDWSSTGIVLAGVTTDYMRPKRSREFGRTVSTFSRNLQSPYWHFWHHLLEILNSSQLASLHKTVAPAVRPATSAFLIEDAGVNTGLQQEGLCVVVPGAMQVLTLCVKVMRCLPDALKPASFNWAASIPGKILYSESNFHQSPQSGGQKHSMGIQWELASCWKCHLNPRLVNLPFG